MRLQNMFNLIEIQGYTYPFLMIKRIQLAFTIYFLWSSQKKWKTYLPSKKNNVSGVGTVCVIAQE